MNTILAAWSEVRVGVRSLTSFCALLADPATEDEFDIAGDEDWDTYGDLIDLAGRYVEEQIDANTFESLVAARLQRATAS